MGMSKFQTVRRAAGRFMLCIGCLGMISLSGCQAFLGPDADDTGSNLPWSQPAEWEGNIIGLPY